MATAEGAPPGVAEQQVEKGLKSGALGLVSATVMGVASTAPAYSLAATLGFIVAVVGLGSPIVAVHRVHPDLPHLDRLQRAEQGRPGLRHDVHLGRAGVRAEDRLGRRLGDRRRRRARHGQPRAGRRAVRVPAVRREGHRRQRDERLGAARRPGCGSPSMTYICYRGIEVSATFQRVLLGVELVMLLVFSATALIRVGTGNHPAGSITPAWSWFNPHAGRLHRVRQRHHPHAVHLLGLGHRGGGQRGDQGPGQDAGPRGHPVHGHPAGHLRHRDPVGAVVRGHRHHGHRARQQRQHRRRALRARQRGLRRLRASGCSSPGC